jgi:hypothetical protein
VLLRTDTRVTNHGFRSGRATPRQSVLQAGTAVLVDRSGVPRVRCACGNPLAPPVAVRSANYQGPRWSGFDPTLIVVVSPSPSPVTGFVLIDASTGATFGRPVATSGGSDVDAALPDEKPAKPTTTTTKAPPKTTTTTAPPPPVDISRTGAVSASTEYSGEFPAALALDNNRQTSWFSAGPEAGTSTFLWQAPAPQAIQAITIESNRDHPQFPTGFGFGNVTIRVVDASGNTAFEESVALGGTPDPDVTVTPGGVTGKAIVLEFSGHEAPDCGGFAELRVSGRQA